MTQTLANCITVRLTLVWLAGAGTLLSGCSQSPAPIVDGFSQQTRVVENFLKYGSFTDRVSQGAGSRQAKPVQSAPVLTQTVATPAIQEDSLQPVRTVPTRTMTKAAIAPRQLAAPAHVAPQILAGPQTYTVQPGDTLFKIARERKISAYELAKANGQPQPFAVNAGQLLKLPGQPAVPEKVLEARMGRLEPSAGERIPAREVADDKANDVGVTYVTHRVAMGETVYRISQQYRASVIDIMAANDFQTPQQLQAGMLVKVPTGHEKLAQGAQPVQVTATAQNQPLNVNNEANADLNTPAVKPVESAPAVAISYSENASRVAVNPPKMITALDEVKAQKFRGKIDAQAARANGLAWPVQGNVIRRFGEQGNGVTHTGINIAVPENTPVLATEGGTVIYEGNGLKTYGQLVLLRHPDGMVSAYAHNNQLLVRKGEQVRKGQVIALSGASGNVESPQLHFEVRRAAHAIDPMRVLAAR